LLSFVPRPEPDFLPPPSSLLTVAQARRSASSFFTPRFSYPFSISSALRFCLSVYADLSPRGMSLSSPQEMRPSEDETPARLGGSPCSRMRSPAGRIDRQFACDAKRQ
jgi:hypothetical protein